jgi:hypothetical protein
MFPRQGAGKARSCRLQPRGPGRRDVHASLAISSCLNHSGILTIWSEMSRPFFRYHISELEAEFARRKHEPEFLRDLIHELGHRKGPRALRLRSQAVEMLASIQSSPPPPKSAGEPSRHGEISSQAGLNPPRSIPPLKAAEISAAKPPDERRPPVPSVANTPEGILDAWTALEVLCPPPFRRPEDLAGGDRQAVAWLDREHLPWEGKGEKARPNTKLYYQIVLGAVDLGAATEQLLSRYSDSRVERPTARGETLLAVVIVNREGRLIEAPAVSISGFAWGVPRALRYDLAGLGEWRTAEKPLIEGLDEVLRRAQDGAEGEELPLDRAAITAGWEWLVANLGLPRDLVAPPRFAIRSFEYFKNTEPPEPLLLNSFFLGDLGVARTLFCEDRPTPNLRRYLGCEVPEIYRDLLQDTKELEAAVAPELIPPARWPGPGRHPLVLLQQAAVNLAFKELKSTGILAVNGPPGTGKTTLLRDLVAGVVTARAEVMAGFDDPSEAFTPSGERLRAGHGWLHLYRLDPRLKGFEMVVASSNNKAVENVSAKLPALKAVADDAKDLRYFTSLSDSLLQRETWGLVAAVLGNAANRGRFKRTFWWDDDVGLATYLAEAAGTPQLIEVTDPETGAQQTRPPRIVSEEQPPRTHQSALQRWQKARSAFLAALQRSRDTLDKLAKVRELAAALPSLAREEAEATLAAAQARDVEISARASVEVGRSNFVGAERELKRCVDALRAHDERAPGFFARLFGTRRAREWRSGRIPIAQECKRARELHSEALQSVSELEGQLRNAITKHQAAERRRIAVADRHGTVRREVAAARERIGRGFIDEDFFAREHADKQTTVPWLNAEQQRARDEVFVAAVALHKAFVDAAAQKLRHNLGVLINVLGGRSLPTAEKRALIPDLWSSFFIAVPLISTTFASVERMFGDLPAEGLGWLFVDEAGQAVPQAAVGALMHTRRAVIVGDPMQIEPIVTLPEALTQAICRQFGVDPDRFNAPNASVQTLADAATPYVAEFQAKYGSRRVGVPLLVHRRCAEPMFGTANAAAYDHQMVNAKLPSSSKIGEILGPSAWIDVCGSSVEKWCPEEGELVLALLRRLAEKRIEDPDLYIITPFVVVAHNLRKLVRESGLPSEWTSDPWRWTAERIGTIHTVQGREAEAVLLVLGAPAPHQTGARGWAGGRPNLLNVAVTRAKERLYVIGNRRLWREAGLFRELDQRLLNLTENELEPSPKPSVRAEPKSVAHDGA